MIVLFAGIAGLIPEDVFIMVYLLTMIAIVAYIVASFLYPFFSIAGKPMLAVSFYRSSSESEWAFGKIAESEGGILFRECPGGNKDLLCAEIQSVPFLGTRVPFKMIVLKFPEGVDAAALFDNDYVEPESGLGRIPVRIAYLSGVQIGEMTLSQNTAFKSLKDRILEYFGRRVERIERIPIVYVTRYKIRKIKVLGKASQALKVACSKLLKKLGRDKDPEKAPIVLVTGHKVADIKMLAKITKELKEIAGYQETKGSSKAWVSELGQVRLISTELEELRADNMKLRQIIRGLERIYQSPPSITTASIDIEEESSRRYMYVKQAAVGAGAAVLVFLVLLILGLL
jgi:hypothetical protein